VCGGVCVGGGGRAFYYTYTYSWKGQSCEVAELVGVLVAETIHPACMCEGGGRGGERGGRAFYYTCILQRDVGAPSVGPFWNPPKKEGTTTNIGRTEIRRCTACSARSRGGELRRPLLRGAAGSMRLKMPKPSWLPRGRASASSSSMSTCPPSESPAVSPCAHARTAGSKPAPVLLRDART
jgi:hypothetical protein